MKTENKKELTPFKISINLYKYINETKITYYHDKHYHMQLEQSKPCWPDSKVIVLVQND